MKTAQRSKRFREWFDGLPDATIRAAISQRIERLERGLPGDVGSVGNGVHELRIHLGSGWRIYYIEVGATLILLLGGGTKRTQQADINQARKTVLDLEEKQRDGKRAAPAAKPASRKK
ncbi:type II toxin-antitoxin system RelE/ParE family toxin [Rugamonas sp. CCM 8940]|uniref:type II toxin-antitoxin system RelE/ParE family toxin n=1 Tax=Rugamonas sp. CCM 8940 TaxID=2765359 RepID=UPI0018F2D9DD|nr:type II toxin-antitoxin system RelE/ParE family toxin [Rugamonas sp. CCM 8940]MBJ7309464.1 type II toxin-antitoxin system RelE/ParE family toxin [Rugamonas sp. CCM 8940]